MNACSSGYLVPWVCNIWTHILARIKILILHLVGFPYKYEPIPVFPIQVLWVFSTGTHSHLYLYIVTHPNFSQQQLDVSAKKP